MAGRPTKSDPVADDDAADPSVTTQASSRIPTAEGATPSMAQFLEIKAANPDSILWYRMGDFYELFFEDAVVASDVLGIVLTKRGKHLGQDIPMCGVPIHRADEYLQRLIKRGLRVAVCEQLEDPAEAKKRGAKAVVRRDVVRLVTPGTLTEDTLLDAKRANFLTAIMLVPAERNETERLTLASLDISTGESEIATIARADLHGELSRLGPAEILAVDTLLIATDLKAWLEHTGTAATPVPGQTFDSLAGDRLLKASLGVTDLQAFGDLTRTELAAMGALLKYVELTQIGKRPVVLPPRRAGAGAVLVIDAATRSSLELVQSSSGEKAGSLLGAIDRTVTGPGARELARRLASPERDLSTIEARLDAIQHLVKDDFLRANLREALRRTPDIQRAVSRLAFQRGGPRDLGAVRDGLATAQRVVDLLTTKPSAATLPRALAQARASLADHGPDLGPRLNAALVDEPPPFRRDGGFIREGFDKDLDAARALRDNSRRVMAELEARYVETTGIKSLKIRHNNILGYFVEVTANTAKPLQSPPHADVFRHRQTMANAMRFTTDELIAIEGQMSTAGERALGIEQQIFLDLTDVIARAERALGAISRALADLDCVQGLAEIAAEEDYVRPVLDHSTTFEIRGGRHPVVEQALKRARSGVFIANDCVLGRPDPKSDDIPLPEGTPQNQRPQGFDETRHGRLWLVTGPNMAGKSTFLRQNALIVVLAQMGAFVPAERAHIGLVDRLFSRVGASDDIARGRSTFMVEMVETAGILNQATDKSLVILDEIGRGTATFDGLSIAWATVEYLHDKIRCRALFATHYHELTVLAKRLESITNVTIEVRDWQDEIVFLHKVKQGAADRSYGIQVAKLAGLPGAVIDRASDVLAALEKGDQKLTNAQALVDDLPLFSVARPKSVPPQKKASKSDTPQGPSEIEKAVADLNPDDMTPKAALDALYKLKTLSAKKP
jgi:DNA mismatch repair protein MutS